MIRVIYRSYGGENMKDRPPYYTKKLALASFIRAAQRAEVPILYINDGPIPEPLDSMMRATGEVVQIAPEAIGMRGSYWYCLNVARERGWPDDDLVFFSEDDYLYHPDAFVKLKAADADLHNAVYLALYGSTQRFMNDTEFPGGERYPDDFRRHADQVVDGVNWAHIPSTTSSFGARVGALNDDLSIFRQGMFPFRTRLLDHETCLLYQGHTPYSLTEIVTGEPGCYPWTTWGMARRFGLTHVRVALNIRAAQRRHRPHPLFVAEPNLACHMETPVMTPGRDWAAIAEDTRLWFEASALPGVPERA